MSDYSTKNRNKQIVQMRNDGMTYEKIGQQFGITRERARQIYIRMTTLIETYEKKEQNEKEYLRYKQLFMNAAENLGFEDRVGTRVYRCLCRAKVIDDLINGVHILLDYEDEYLMRIRNFGDRSLVVAREAERMLANA